MKETRKSQRSSSAASQSAPTTTDAPLQIDHGHDDHADDNDNGTRTTMTRTTRNRRRVVVLCSIFMALLVISLSVALTLPDADNENSELMSSNNSAESNAPVRPPSSSISSPSASSSMKQSTDDSSSNNNSNSNNDVSGSDVFLPTASITLPPSTASSSDTPSMVPSTSPSWEPSSPLMPSSSPSQTSTADPNALVTIQAGYELLEVVPHNTNAFTQGLEVLSLTTRRLGDSNPTNATSAATQTTTPTSRYMIESTGLYSQSDLRVVDIATGNVLTIVPVDSQYFAEGCTFDIVNEFTNPVDGTQITTIQIVQLTWKEGEGLVYELDLPFDGTNTPTTTQLRYIGTFDIDTTTGEGWGIAYHPVRKQYVVSDGSSNLHFWELQGQSVAINAFGQSETKLTFVRVDTIGVTQRFSTSQGWTPVSNLNELEWDPYPSLLDDGGSLLATNDDDTILANIWKTDYIVRIRLSDGKITHQYDMSSLDRPASASVLNGIAAVKDSSTDPTALYSSVALAQNQYWITGKWWSQMYRIKLLP